MCLITEHAKLRQENERLLARVSELEIDAVPPIPKPTSNVVIGASALKELLRPYGIVLSGGTSDATYLLLTRAEAQSFLDWYRDIRQYTTDDYDCDAFAWLMRAAAIRWMEGKYAWGYVEGEGQVDPLFTFPNHAFNFVVTDDYRVWYCDELCLAAPEDELMEAYPVKCYMAKI